MLAPRAWTPRLRRDLCTVWRGARRTAYADRTATGTTLPFTYSRKALSWIRKVVSTIRRTPAYRAVLKIKPYARPGGRGKAGEALKGFIIIIFTGRCAFSDVQLETERVSTPQFDEFHEFRAFPWHVR